MMKSKTAPDVGTAQPDHPGQDGTEPTENQHESQARGPMSTVLEIAPVAEYAKRLASLPQLEGATIQVRSIRKLAILEQVGRYPRSVGTIRFDVDGTAHASAPEFAPTEEEQARIKEAFRFAELPEYQPRRHMAPGEPHFDDAPWQATSKMYFCWDRQREHLLFAQERRELPDGSKIYLPWSPHSDRKWHQVEPLEGLPLFGLEQLKEGSSSVILHEGPKAAMAARDIGAEYDKREMEKVITGESPPGHDHPWGEELRNRTHIAWLGGAERPQDTLWGELKTAGVKHVTMVCDHDQPGMAAAGQISRTLGLPMAAVMFDERWPEGADIADPFPEEFWRTPEKDGRSVYSGPSMQECTQPCTWATNQIPAEGAGRPAFGLTRHFLNEWLYTVSPPMFVHRARPSKLYSEAEFNTLVRATSDVTNTARLMHKSIGRRADAITYNPGLPPGVIAGNGLRWVNTHLAPAIKKVKGSPWPWLRYITHLFPNKADRIAVLRWVATLIARPDIRMQFALLLMSETQGVGKTTLIEILKWILGGDNVSTPGEKDLDSAFNGWIAHKRLVAVNELYTGQSRKMYDALKGLITDPEVRVNLKFQSTYELDNRAHFIACSNSKVPLYMEDNDRRWGIPEVTERKMPRSYWVRFYAWLKADGLGIIRQWAEDFLQKHEPVMPGEWAPTSAAKAELIEASVPEWRRAVADAAEALVALGAGDAETGEPPRRIIVTIKDVKGWLVEHLGLQASSRRMPGERAIRDALAKAGMTVRAGDEKVRVGTMKMALALNFTPDPGEKWPALLKNHLVSMDKEVANAF